MLVTATASNDEKVTTTVEVITNDINDNDPVFTPVSKSSNDVLSERLLICMCMWNISEILQSIALLIFIILGRGTIYV